MVIACLLVSLTSSLLRVEMISYLPSDYIPTRSKYLLEELINNRHTFFYKAFLESKNSAKI